MGNVKASYTLIAEQTVAIIQLIISTWALTVIVRKIRCPKSGAQRQYSVSLSTEWTLYTHFAVSIIWSLSHSTFFTLNELSYAMIIPVCSCNIVGTTSMLLNTVSSWTLANFLIDRVTISFETTPLQMNRCIEVIIRCSVTILWIGIAVLFLLPMTPHICNSEQCFDHIPEELQQSMLPFAISLMACKLFITLALYLIFVSKLHSFHQQLQVPQSGKLELNGNENAYLMVLIKKQSMIMLWISASTVVLVAVNIALAEPLRRVPMMVDSVVNNIAIFLSLSFNEAWFILFRCDQCIICLFECPFRSSMRDDEPQSDPIPELQEQGAGRMSHPQNESGKAIKALPLPSGRPSHGGHSQQMAMELTSVASSSRPSSAPRHSRGRVSRELSDMRINSVISRSKPILKQLSRSADQIAGDILAAPEPRSSRNCLKVEPFADPLESETETNIGMETLNELVGDPEIPMDEVEQCNEPSGREHKERMEDSECAPDGNDEILAHQMASEPSHGLNSDDGPNVEKEQTPNISITIDANAARHTFTNSEMTTMTSPSISIQSGHSTRL